MINQRHTLIIGGTGMLFEATCELAKGAQVLTSVASTRRSLAALNQAVDQFSCEHHALQLDWGDRRNFLAKLSEHVTRVGSPTLALVWVHQYELGAEIAQTLSPFETGCHFFQVFGSDGAGQAKDVVTTRTICSSIPTLTYHQIVLGSIREGSRSRWLSNSEISAGAIEAVRNPKAFTVVGRVE